MASPEVSIPDPLPVLPLWRRLLDGLKRHLDPPAWLQWELAQIDDATDDELPTLAVTILRDHIHEDQLVEKAMRRYADIDRDAALLLMRLEVMPLHDCACMHHLYGMMLRENHPYDAVYHLRRASHLIDHTSDTWVFQLATAEAAIGDHRNAIDRCLDLRERHDNPVLADVLELSLGAGRHHRPDGLLERVENRLATEDVSVELEEDIRQMLEQVRPWYVPQDLGEYLVERAVITPYTAERTRAEAERSERALVDVLMEEGWLSDAELKSLMVDRFNVADCRLEHFDISEDTLLEIPGDLARRYGVMPIRATPSSLLVAVSEPDGDILAGLSLVTGKNVFPVITSYESLARHIAEYYGAPRESVGAS